MRNFYPKLLVWGIDLHFLRGGVNFNCSQAHCESDWPKGRERLQKIDAMLMAAGVPHLLRMIIKSIHLLNEKGKI